MEERSLEDKKHLTIFQLNDIHGYLDLHPEMFIENGKEQFRNAGGYARIATVLREAREKDPEGVLIFDNGDTFHGTYPVVDSQGEVLLPILNALQIDAMTTHWDFAYGPGQLKNLLSNLNYPMLACNIYDEGTGEPVFPPYVIMERAGLKIGVIGLAEHIVDKMMPEHFSEGLRFTLGVEEVRKRTAQLRQDEAVDLVIVLSHFGFPQDVKLAKETDGIDILLSGHTHNALRQPAEVNGALIIQSGCHGTHIGRLDLEVRDGRIISHSHQLMEIEEGIRPDEEVQAMIDDAAKPYRKTMNEEIGHTSTNLHRYNQLETTMDNLLLNSLLAASDAEIAFSNGWRYGAPIPAGPVTMNDLWNIIPTNPPVSVTYLSGREIIDMMEENMESTFASDPYDQMGGYLKRCMGLKMYIKIENPKGMRIQDVFINGEPLDENRYYLASFVTVQGIPMKYGENRRNLDVRALDALRDYVIKSGTVSAELLGTVQIV